LFFADLGFKVYIAVRNSNFNVQLHAYVWYRHTVNLCCK